MEEYELTSIGNYDSLKERHIKFEAEYTCYPELMYYQILVKRCNALMDQLELFEKIISENYDDKDLEQFFNTFYGIVPYEKKHDLNMKNISAESLMIDYNYYKKYALNELRSNLALLNAVLNEEKEEFLVLSLAQHNVKEFILEREN